MTKRVVSLMGVAAVATMVILAGCSSGPGAEPVDHVAALAGTWMTAELDGHVEVPAALQASMMLPPIVPVTRTASVVIEDGDGTQEGTFALTVTDVPVDLAIRAVVSRLVSMTSGTINVQNDSQMTVTLTGEITIVPPLIPVPADVASLRDTPVPVAYELMDNELNLTSTLFFGLGVTTAPDEKLTLTKQE